MVVLEDRVFGLMVLLPMTTKLLDLPVWVRTGPDEVAVEAGTTVRVALCDVTVLPALSVVVTGTEVSTVEDAVLAAASLLGDASLEDGPSELAELWSALDVGLASVLLGVLTFSLVVVWSLLVGDVVVADVGSAVVEVGVSEDVVAGVSLVSLVDVSEVDVGSVDVLVVTPVPTACLLFGMTPSWTVSGWICAKPRTGKRENMVGGDGRCRLQGYVCPSQAKLLARLDSQRSSSAVLRLARRLSLVIKPLPGQTSPVQSDKMYSEVKVRVANIQSQ